MVAKVEFDPGIDQFGKEIRIIAVHMHNTLVNGKWKPELQQAWAWCHALCVKHNVDVVMCDFTQRALRARLQRSVFRA